MGRKRKTWGLTMIKLIIGIALIILLVYHWELIDKAFVKFLENVAGI